MGTQTVRLLSPTLALLNIRLGYWLCNPRELAKHHSMGSLIYRRITEKFYLMVEMLNKLKETSQNVYLTDGGHIENLGVVTKLLKRGCELILVIDAEADPYMSFRSLMKLERYARIDFGVRIVLPFAEIAQMMNSVSEALGNGNGLGLGSRGPHCSVGRIFYENGAEGIIVYFKSSLTGDEKDYILDYKKRYPAFPHEATDDQFFSEEQFEVIRALGTHMVNGFLDGLNTFSFVSTGPGAFVSQEAAFAEVMAKLGYSGREVRRAAADTADPPSRPAQIEDARPK